MHFLKGFIAAIAGIFIALGLFIYTVINICNAAFLNEKFMGSITNELKLFSLVDMTLTRKLPEQFKPFATEQVKKEAALLIEEIIRKNNKLLVENFFNYIKGKSDKLVLTINLKDDKIKIKELVMKTINANIPAKLSEMERKLLSWQLERDWQAVETKIPDQLDLVKEISTNEPGFKFEDLKLYYRYYNFLTTGLLIALGISILLLFWGRGSLGKGLGSVGGIILFPGILCLTVFIGGSILNELFIKEMVPVVDGQAWKIVKENTTFLYNNMKNIYNIFRNMALIYIISGIGFLIAARSMKEKKQVNRSS